MYRLFVLLLVIPFFFASTPVMAGDDKIVLWGTQTAGWGATNAKTDGNRVELTKTAEIVKVEGDAKSFCIWSGGRSVLCGSKEKDIVGETLGPGTYTVMAGLNGTKSAKVTITLKYK